jgi:cytidylate kinase
MIIAIDGPAGSGKSTTAKLVAEKMNWMYMDTGAMYRAITLAALRHKVDFDNPAELGRFGRQQAIDQTLEEGVTVTLLNGENVTAFIRNPDVTAAIKTVADNVDIREHLVEIQRKIGRRQNSVVDGRDIGTVVFPAADLKIYMTANIDERSRRRKIELDRRNIESDIDQIKAAIQKRDEDDRSRPVGALKAAEDAIYFDATDYSINEQVNYIVKLWHNQASDQT